MQQAQPSPQGAHRFLLKVIKTLFYNLKKWTEYSGRPDQEDLRNQEKFLGWYCYLGSEISPGQNGENHFLKQTKPKLLDRKQDVLRCHPINHEQLCF